MTAGPDELTDRQRRALRIEIVVVLAVTFGLSAYTAVVHLAESVLLGLSGQVVALNPRRSTVDLIDLALNLSRVFSLLAWGALGVYLLWRGGLGPDRIGLGRPRWRRDLGGGVALAALIGIPGLLLYQLARVLGMNASVEPAELYDTWWRIPVLLALAFGNGWAEEVIVVGFLLTRLRQLRVSPAVAVFAAAVLRGLYHLYQGFGAGLGNLAMGLVFGWVYLRTGRLWPLIIAHALIDAVAFVGYALAAGHLGWLR
ncbi:MAG: CPBP family intramembrane metalloprotease [Mycolicibacterium hassiacum]|uniref:CPBP family intramembrane glutamic endopeptidase n=1 Tax=Mycolicibacterium hassiacum TaxID=46351 RepID=UPI0023F72907|nr:CPBP family intramembrane glutamic endopeptidase [Mycolicibacterium hassiacum]MBX5489405.1 CPBP family intramembrane metalloprotease [Mycolicibacterium hassiacum]